MLVMTSYLKIDNVPTINLWAVFVITIFLQHLLIVVAKQNQLVYTIQLMREYPYIQGQTLTYQSFVKHEPSSNETAENVTVEWVLPSSVSYQSYESLSSAKTPNDVSSNINTITMNFGSLSPSEEINILINVTLDPGHTLRDKLFRHVTISITLKYRWSNECSKEKSSSKALHFPFFCPECSNFGSLGTADGNIKDSHIQASTVQRYRSNNMAWEWKPMTSFDHLNLKRKMKFNFLQIDLKSSRQVDMVFIDGVPARDPIPWNIIQLSFSHNSWKWKTQKNLQKVEVFQGEDIVAVAITTLKPIKTRFIRINVPPYGLLDQTTYKVQLFGCNPSEGLSQDPPPVGIEFPSLVPDSRFSSPSILGPQYQPHFGRLNNQIDGGSWCASGCSPLEYLQIDFGDTWKISEIENQGRHSTNGTVFAVKTYSLSSSLDGASWTPYKSNGETKIFWGNDVANLATRHKLFQALTVKYVRFEPRTCTESVACIRVELYGTKTSVENRKVLPGVVFGRSILLKPSENMAFVCNTEVAENNAHCFSSKDKGSTWEAVPFQVLSVLAYDSTEQRLYGLTRNGKNILKSKDPNGDKWRGIPLKDWFSVKDGSSVYTAVEIPFVPISRTQTNVVEPLVQLTALNGDEWQADQIGVYYKPVDGASKMVLSFLPYSQDLSPNPCHTGVCLHGRCEQLVRSQFKCHCRQGYTGRFCDTATDYCLSNPCQNGGTCSPLFMFFNCSCQPGYSGERCQDYDECISSPCLNGGTCVDGGNNFTCTCAPNYRGVTCQDFDDCASSPCLHGGTCTDGASSYKCSCLAGYSGTNCQVMPCSSSPCLNGGTCSHPNSGGYLCACNIRYSGPHCGNGGFVTSRGSRGSSLVWSYSSGKYDKLVFYSDRNLTVFGVCLSDTFASGSDVSCSFESRIRKEGSSTILASRSAKVYCEKDNKYVNCPSFASPYLMIAGTRYIIEVRMDSTENFRKVTNGVSSRKIYLRDGSLSVTYNYETVDAAELADSNGSTQSEGGITGLLTQIAHG